MASISYSLLNSASSQTWRCFKGPIGFGTKTGSCLFWNTVYIPDEMSRFHIFVDTNPSLLGLPQAWWRPPPDRIPKRLRQVQSLLFPWRQEFHWRLQITTATRIQKQFMGFSPITLVRKSVHRERPGHWSWKRIKVNSAPQTPRCCANFKASS